MCLQINPFPFSFFFCQELRTSVNSLCNPHPALRNIDTSGMKSADRIRPSEFSTKKKTLRCIHECAGLEGAWGQKRTIRRTHDGFALIPSYPLLAAGRLARRGARRLGEKRFFSSQPLAVAVAGGHASANAGTGQ